jgi:RHS repeat-associated protein
LDPFSRYTVAHDGLDRVTRVDNTGTPGVLPVVLSYAYDAVGNLLSVADNQRVTVSSTYDVRNQLISRTWTGPALPEARVGLAYDDAGQRVRLERFSDAAGTALVARTQSAYDPAGRLTALTHTNAGGATIADYQYTYDLAGQLTAESHHGQTASYAHDLAGHHFLRPTRASRTSSTPTTPTATDRPGSRCRSNNQVLADDRFDYAYDNEGNLVQKTERATGEVTTYTYDYRNRLTAVERRSAGGIILSESEYTYDVFDRRIVTEVDGVTRITAYDGHHPWVDFDAAGNVEARYLFGAKVDEILARWRPGDGQAWYLTDHLNTVRDLINAGGVVINHVDYGSFGQLLAQTNPLAGDRFLFTGREFDFALGLYYYRARFYDPCCGSSPAGPMGFGAGDANLRRYVGNRPLTATDPFGREAVVAYPKLFVTATTVAGAIIGGTLGFLCGFLDAWFSDNPQVSANALSYGWRSAAIRAALGAAAAASSAGRERPMPSRRVGGAIGLGGIFAILAFAHPEMGSSSW